MNLFPASRRRPLGQRWPAKNHSRVVVDHHVGGELGESCGVDDRDRDERGQRRSRPVTSPSTMIGVAPRRDAAINDRRHSSPDMTALMSGISPILTYGCGRAAYHARREEHGLQGSPITVERPHGPGFACHQLGSQTAEFDRGPHPFKAESKEFSGEEPARSYTREITYRSVYKIMLAAGPSLALSAAVAPSAYASSSEVPTSIAHTAATMPVIPEAQAAYESEVATFTQSHSAPVAPKETKGQPWLDYNLALSQWWNAVPWTAVYGQWGCIVRNVTVTVSSDIPGLALTSFCGAGEPAGNFSTGISMSIAPKTEVLRSDPSIAKTYAQLTGGNCRRYRPAQAASFTIARILSRRIFACCLNKAPSLLAPQRNGKEVVRQPGTSASEMSVLEDHAASELL